MPADADEVVIDENHGKSPASITEIPHPLSDEVDDKVHHNEVCPIKADDAYANQPEGTHSPWPRREKTWKHTYPTNGDGVDAARKLNRFAAEK